MADLFSTLLSRREAIVALAATAVDPHSLWRSGAQIADPRCREFFGSAAAEPRGRLQAFERGDVFVGATRLDNAEDAYAGRGRILQFDERLRLKAVLWPSGTTHQLVSLDVDRRGLLWAFDPANHAVVQVEPSGTQRPQFRFGERPFGSVAFARDGRVFLGEYFRGASLPPGRCIRLAMGGNSLGEGAIYEFDAEWHMTRELAYALVREATAPEAVTHLSLHPSQEVLAFAAGGGKHVMRYDLRRGRLMADLVAYGGFMDRPPRIAAIRYVRDGRLLLIRDDTLEVLDEAGRTRRQWNLGTTGWVAVTPTHDGAFCIAANGGSGVLIKVSLETGAVDATFDGLSAEPRRAATGVVEYWSD